MAHCAPRQLGTCLPTIVPVMADAVSDSKAQVRDAAKAALNQVGSVIKNPEILAIAKVIINSLSDPELTAKALEVVIDTTFVNAVDAASLALLVPVIKRGLKHRSTELKKRAATIVGNMCNLVADAKDVAPYIQDLLPIIKTSILDPSPEMRATAAQAHAQLAMCNFDVALVEDIEEQAANDPYTSGDSLRSAMQQAAALAALFHLLTAHLEV